MLGLGLGLERRLLLVGLLKLRLLLLLLRLLLRLLVGLRGLGCEAEVILTMRHTRGRAGVGRCSGRSRGGKYLRRGRVTGRG